MERIQKIIAASGVCSRRKAEELIKAGKVKVNGHTITEMGYKVDVNDNIVVDGKGINVEKKVYYILNKPRNVICTVTDDKERDTIVELIDEEKRIFPVGRLDFDTTGLIILTNDGELANILMHPRNEVPKTYVARIDGILSMEEYFSIKTGIEIDGEKIIPTRLKIMSKNEKANVTIVRITVCEGKNHMIKKIFEQVKHPVLKLNRTEYGFLNLHGLNVGDYRKLTQREIEDLYTYKK